MTGRRALCGATPLNTAAALHRRLCELQLRISSADSELPCGEQDACSCAQLLAPRRRELAAKPAAGQRGAVEAGADAACHRHAWRSRSPRATQLARSWRLGDGNRCRHRRQPPSTRGSPRTQCHVHRAQRPGERSPAERCRGPGQRSSAACAQVRTRHAPPNDGKAMLINAATIATAMTHSISVMPRPPGPRAAVTRVRIRVPAASRRLVRDHAVSDAQRQLVRKPGSLACSWSGIGGGRAPRSCRDCVGEHRDAIEPAVAELGNALAELLGCAARTARGLADVALPAPAARAAARSPHHRGGVQLEVSSDTTATASAIVTLPITQAAHTSINVDPRCL